MADFVIFKEIDCTFGGLDKTCLTILVTAIYNEKTEHMGSFNPSYYSEEEVVDEIKARMTRHVKDSFSIVFHGKINKIIMLKRTQDEVNNA